MDIKIISANIKKYRELKGLTREGVASELDMSVSGYSKIERGEIEIETEAVNNDKTVNNIEESKENLLKLSKVFPNEVEAYIDFKRGFVTVKDIEILLSKERCRSYKQEDEKI
jgi:transcriptional regulator with XRE-family HTH domain